MVLEDLFDVMRGFESDQDDKYSLTAYYLNRNHLGIFQTGGDLVESFLEELG
jgi:hypothetical protein